MGKREENRMEVTARILKAARKEIQQKGGVGLSMRAVAREVGVSSSAVYRYFATREDLITAMIIESYGNLDRALDGKNSWGDLAVAFRQWAKGHVHEFQLIYGTPIPSYCAPPETVPAAERVAEHFLRAGGGTKVPEFDQEVLRQQMGSLSGMDDPAGAAAVLAELSALVGFVSLEIAGHFVGTADPADQLFDALIQRQHNTLGTSG